MESKEFDQLITSVKEQLDNEHLEYAIIVHNPSSEEGECIIGIHSKDACDTLTSALVNEASEKNKLIRSFIAGIVSKVFVFAAKRFNSHLKKSTKKDINYN